MPTDLMRMAAMPTGGGGDNKVSTPLGEGKTSASWLQESPDNFGGFSYP